MSSAQAERSTSPQVVEHRSHDDDLIHIVCDIHDDLALCGEVIPGDRFTDDDDPGPVCPLCGLGEDEGVPCVVPGCPGYRPAWRRLVHKLSGGRRG